MNKGFQHEQPAPLLSVFGLIENITPSEVKKAISGMKNGKATGPDEIPADLWKQASKVGVIWLTNIFNQIIKSGKMPDMWRLSNLIPFYKNKVNIAECENYRAIKLTSHTLNIWERVVIDRQHKLSAMTLNQCRLTPGEGTTGHTLCENTDEQI